MTVSAVLALLDAERDERGMSAWGIGKRSAVLNEAALRVARRGWSPRPRCSG